MASEVQSVRSVFLSDAHIGFPGQGMRDFCQFLSSTWAENIYLLGDIIDPVGSGPAAQVQLLGDLIELLLDRITKGACVFYTPGNHDQLLLRFAGRSFNRFKIERQFVHICPKGRRYLATHGDKFDLHLNESVIQYRSSAWLYALALKIDQAQGRAARSLGRPSSSMCQAIKTRWPGLSERNTVFENEARKAAVEHSCSGVICGHTHSPKIVTDESGFVYINTGDWLEHCSAVIEDFDGKMRIAKWGLTFDFRSAEQLVAA